MGNLTFETGLVRQMAEPRPVPGCHVVLFKELGGGRSFDRVLEPGQPFRKRLAELLSNFSACAVPADPSLRHRFSEQLETGVGELHDHFTLHVSLVYRAAQPEVLAERAERDPLRRLQDEVKDVLLRKASMLRFADLMDGSFDLEGYVLGIREHPPRAGEPSSLERFRDLAGALGIGLDRVEITRTHSSDKIDIGRERTRLGRTTEYRKEKARADHEVETIRSQGRRQVQVLDSLAEGLQTIIRNVSKDVATVREVRGMIGEVVQAKEELGRALGAAPMGAPNGSAGGALGSGTPLRLGSNRPDQLDPVWRQELERMVEVVETLDCRRMEKRILAGKILHVLAEASLAAVSEDGRLEEYVRDLGETCESIDLARAMTSAEHHRYLARLREADALRRLFGGEGVTTGAGEDA